MATTNYNETSNRAGETFEKAKQAAAAGYEETKEKAKETTDKMSKKVADMAQAGAEKLEDVANKLQEGSSDAYKTMIDTVQKHPMASLAAAMLAGAVLVGILRD